METMLDPVAASIVIAVIGMIGGVWAAYISNRNQKDNKTIKEVLSNTKTPVDSLDQIVRLLQEELNRTNDRHDRERVFFNDEIARLRAENQIDRENWEKSEFKMQAEIDKLIGERTEYLKQIRELQNQLSSLEAKVKESLKGVKKGES